MAQRRMFSNRIANSARFLQMPEGAQLLYFHMIQRADDDGIVESYPLMKLLGTAPDNFKVLIAKGFIAELNSDQVIVITDWLEHNVIRADRKVDSIYNHLLPDGIATVQAKPRSDVEDNSRRLGGQAVDSPRSAQVRLGKVSIGKGNKIHAQILFERFWSEYPRKVSKQTAIRSWNKIKPSDELAEKIIEAVSKHKQTEQWTKDGGQFIPHPATWLNQGRWDDEVKINTGRKVTDNF